MSWCSVKMYKLAGAPIEDSDQPAHTRSLIRVFDGRSMGSQARNFFRRKTKAWVRLCESVDCFESSLYAHVTCTLCWISIQMPF